MKIVGIEGVQEFQEDGSIGSRCNMIVELRSGEQFRVPIGQNTYSMLTDLGNMVAMQTGGQEMAPYQQPQPGDQPATKQRLDRTAEPGQRPQTLEDFANTFITGPNSGAPPVPSQMAAEQSDLIGQLAALSGSEALEMAEGQGAEDPLSQLRKIGFLGEPQDVLGAMGPPSTEVPGSDLIESFEDTSDDDEDDPGEEYDDDGDMAEQY